MLSSRWFFLLLLLVGMGTAIDVTVDYSKEIGDIRDHFYGVNTHGIWGSNESWIDIDADGVLDTHSNYTWHREKLLAAGIDCIRADMNLQYVYEEFTNGDAETWVATTNELGSGSGDIPYAWTTNTASGGVGNISQTADAHAGTYSVKVANTGGAGAVFSSFGLGVLPTGHIYNFSVWIKSSNTTTVTIQRQDTWGYGCTATSTGSGGWELVSCEHSVIDDVKEGWRITIETDAGEEALWDDATFTKDGSNYKAWNTANATNNANIDKDKSLVKWAYENDITILYIASYMHPAYANISSNCNSSTWTCGPKNNTEWAELVVSYIDIVTENGIYNSTIEIEVGNEVDVHEFWLSDLPNSDTNRSVLYNAMYGPMYDAIKAKYPDMLVGGPANSDTNVATTTVFEGLLQEYPDKLDFVSVHRYWHSTHDDFDALLQTDYSWVWANISHYNVTTSRVLMNEWNVCGADIQINQTDRFGMQLGLAYLGTLNSYPENTTLAMYEWAWNRNYTAGNKWAMLAEPNLENEQYISYNVTKDFANYHRTSSTVFNSTTSDADIRAVTSKPDSTHYYITVINGKNETADITLHLANTQLRRISNLADGTVHGIIGGEANLGVFSAYEIRHYQGIELESESIQPINFWILLTFLLLAMGLYATGTYTEDQTIKLAGVTILLLTGLVILTQGISVEHGKIAVIAGNTTTETIQYQEINTTYTSGLGLVFILFFIYAVGEFGFFSKEQAKTEEEKEYNERTE